MRKNEKLSILNLSRQDVPNIIEDIKTRYSWIPVGIHHQDDFFEELTEAYNTSTTNAACIDGTADLIYGKGITSTDDEFNKQLGRILPAEDLRKVSFDLKLYGNAAFQVKWNEDHTQIKKLYHIPVQYLRAKKITDTAKIESYYYCTDWSDYRKQKRKIEIPVLGS